LSCAVDRSHLHGPFADLPRSKAQAKAEGQRLYFLGLSCMRGHQAPRTTHGHHCQGCTKETERKASQERHRAARRAAKLAAKHEAQDAAREARRAAAEVRRLARIAEKAAATRARKAAERQQARQAIAAPEPAPAPATYPLPEVFAALAGPSDAAAAPWD
jgi:hypothetical protein